MPDSITTNGRLTEETALAHADEFIAGLSDQWPRRGIVICGGGVKYFTNAWVCINMLRRVGCKLPIQIWHLGPEEVDEQMRSLVAPLGVECVDGLEVRKCHPARILNGWELKPFSIMYSPFQEVLSLDADNVPLLDPEFLFETAPYRETGAIFWPDYGRLEPERTIWRLCGVEYRDEPEFESGQIVVDKARCWKALRLTMWYNEHSDFFYQHIHGDKETFHLAWRKLGQPYSMPVRGIHTLPSVMCQHDFDGRRIFQHRNMDKWNLFEKNPPIPGFQFEEECRGYVAELRRLWKAHLFFDPAKKTEAELRTAEELLRTQFIYRRVGYDERRMSFGPDGFVEEGAASCERIWNLHCDADGLVLHLSSGTHVTCRLRAESEGVWRGRWERHEKMPVELVPVNLSACPAMPFPSPVSRVVEY